MEENIKKRKMLMQIGKKKKSRVFYFWNKLYCLKHLYGNKKLLFNQRVPKDFWDLDLLSDLDENSRPKDDERYWGQLLFKREKTFCCTKVAQKIMLL